MEEHKTQTEATESPNGVMPAGADEASDTGAKHTDYIARWMPIGMCIGIGVGMAIGSAMGNIAIGMCIGLGLGMSLGSVYGSVMNRQNKK